MPTEARSVGTRGLCGRALSDGRADRSSAGRYVRLVVAVLSEEQALRDAGVRLLADGVPSAHVAVAKNGGSIRSLPAGISRVRASVQGETAGACDARAVALALLSSIVQHGDTASKAAAQTCLDWIAPEQWRTIGAQLAIGDALLMLRCGSSDQQRRSSRVLLGPSPSAVRTLELRLPG